MRRTGARAARTAVLDRRFRRMAAALLSFSLLRLAYHRAPADCGVPTHHRGRIVARVEDPRRWTEAELELVPGVGASSAKAIASRLRELPEDAPDLRCLEEIDGVGPTMRHALEVGVRFFERRGTRASHCSQAPRAR